MPPVHSRRIAISSLGLVLSAQFSYCGCVSAAEGVPQTGAGAGINLDLSSKTPLATGAGLIARPVNIRIGSAVQTVNSSMMLTPAQLIAAYQVSSTGSQTLQLGSSGNATGGNFQIGSQFSHAESLLVPQGVTAISNAATAALNLSGNLNNYGTLFAISTNSAITTAAINAANIYNHPGALLSSVIPSEGLAGISNLVSNLNLELHATDSIINSGTISSAGNLSVIAGGEITNSTSTNSPGSVGQMTSAHNLSLVTGAGLLTNSGLIQAVDSINISVQNSLNGLRVNNTGGIIAALGGQSLESTINMRELGYAGSGNTELLGGDWHASHINLHGGSGSVEVAVGNIDGKLNLQAGIAHVLADTPLLSLGNCTVAGDPTYVNAGGAIEISGTLTETAPLAIIAKTDVIAASNAAKIVNHGNPVWIIAGASIDTTNGAATGFANSSSETLPSGALTGGFIQVSSAGGAGGNIDFFPSTVAAGETVIDSSSNVADTAGGDIYLIAVGNGSTGNVIFPTTQGVISINSSGLGNGGNGNISIYSGAASGGSLITGIINNGGNGAAGNVTLKSAQVTFGGGAGACGSCISFDQNGIATGNVVSSTPTNSEFAITGPVSSKGSLNVEAGKILFQGDVAFDGDIDISSAEAKFLGPISAGAGTKNVTIKPIDPSMSIGIDGGSGTMQIEGLSKISANEVTIGSVQGTADIRIITDELFPLGKSKTVETNYNLSFVSSPSSSKAGFNNSGTIILGTGKTLNVKVGGHASIGHITGSANTLNVEAISIAFGHVDLGQSSAATLQSKQNISSINVFSFEPPSILAAETITLTAAQSIAGPFVINEGPLPINTAANVITANAGDAISISNSGTLSNFSSSSSSYFILTNDSATTIGPSGINSTSKVNITSSGNLTVNGIINSNNSDITIAAAGISGVALIDAGSANVTLKPADSKSSIGINGGAGSFQANLSQVSANSITIGSTSGTGAINVGTTTAAQDLTFLSAANKSASFTNTDIINFGNTNLTVNVGGPIDLGTVNGSGTVIFNTNSDVTLSSTGDLKLNTSTANKLTLNSTGVISAVGNISATAELAISAKGIDIPNGVTLEGSSISASGLAGSAFTVANKGTLEATADSVSITSAMNESLILGVPGQSGEIKSSNIGRINVTAPSDKSSSTNLIDVVGSQTLKGSAILSASGISQGISIQGGVDVTGTKNILIDTPNLTLAGTLNGNVVYSAKGIGTIANLDPAVNLDLKNLGNFTFQGKMLSIISAGGIINTAASSLINLSAIADTSGGSLNLIAGFNFTGSSNPTLPPNAGLYQFDGTSNAGKNIDLGKTSIDVSGDEYAGSVLAVATGSIKLGPIKASTLQNGSPGSVTIIGKGIASSSIDLGSGLSAGSSSISITSGTPEITGGQIVIDNGRIFGPGKFSATSLDGNIKLGQINGGRAAITITTGNTGIISQVGASITQSGIATNTKGVISTEGLLMVTSGTKGFSLKTAARKLSVHTDPTAFMANVTITNAVTLELRDSTVGGNFAASSVAKSFGIPTPSLKVAADAKIVSGKNISLKTTNSSLEVGAGASIQAGILDGKQASAPAPIAKSNVLSAGSVSITSLKDAVDVKLNASIVSNGGNVIISGGTINAGESPDVVANGGNITFSGAGTTKASGHLLARALEMNAGNITINSNGGFTVGGNSLVEANKVVTISALSKFAEGTINDGATIKSGSGSNLPGSFKLTLNGSENSKGLKLGSNVHLESNAAELSISSKGNIEIGSGSTIKASGANLMLKGSSIVSIGTTTSNPGVSLTATKIGSTGGAITVMMGTGLLGENSNLNADGSVKISSGLGSLDIDDSSQISSTGNLSISGASKIDIGNNVSFNNAGPISIKTLNGDISIGDSAGEETDITATGTKGSIKISTAGTITLGKGKLDSSTAMSVDARAGASLSGTSIDADSAKITAKMNLAITKEAKISTSKDFTAKSTGGVITIGDGVLIQAGSFGKNSPPNQPFDPALIESKGSIIISSAGSVNIGNDNSWNSIGGNISVTARTNNLQIGLPSTVTDNKFVASGGNIVMLAKGIVIGAAGNYFHAIGMGTSSADNVGGGIEVGSGLISSTALNSALNMKGAPINPLTAGELGAGVLYTGNINGVILAKNKSGSTDAINLNSLGSSPSQLNLNGVLPTGARGGAQVFNAAGTGAAIYFDNATFQTEAFKPIAMVDSVELEEFSGLRMNCASINGAEAFVNPKSKLIRRKDGTVKLLEGEFFLRVSDSVRVSVESAEVTAEKGALVSIKINQGCSYIRACNASGTVRVHVCGQTFVLNSGEELLLTSHKPEQFELSPNDGVGRRHSHTLAITNNLYATISDFAIVSLITASTPIAELRHSPRNKQIIGKMLKTAATIDVVLRHRGPYTAF